MKVRDVKTFYKQNLPHIVPIGATYFVTWRLHGSIPKVALDKLRLEYEHSISKLDPNGKYYPQHLYERRKAYFLAYDDLLDKIKSGPHYLKNSDVAQVVMEALHRFDQHLYDLIAYCIMSNHVHILIDTNQQLPEDVEPQDFENVDYKPLQVIMKRIKGPSAIYANRVLQRKGRFWQKESYDHYVRNNAALARITLYILNNPIKAGIVKEYGEHPFTYLKKDYLGVG